LDEFILLFFSFKTITVGLAIIHFTGVRITTDDTRCLTLVLGKAGHHLDHLVI